MSRPELILRSSEIIKILELWDKLRSVRKIAKLTGHCRDKIKQVLIDSGINIDPLKAKRYDLMDTLTDATKITSKLTVGWLEYQENQAEANPEDYYARLKPGDIQTLQIIQGVALDSVNKVRERGEREEQIIEIEKENIDAVEYVLNKEGRVIYDEGKETLDLTMKALEQGEVILTDKDNATAQIEKPIQTEDEEFLF